MNRSREIFFNFAVILGVAFVASWDLGSWYYSIIGDEYAFYFYALDIVHKGLPEWSMLLNQNGVYGEHPVLSSIPQVIFLKIFGDANVVWRFSSVFTLLLSFPALFYWAKRWYGQSAAVFTTLFYAASHYLIAYAHTGYNNIQAILFPLYTLFFLSRKKFFYVASLLAGIVSGLSFYTFYSARITVFIGILAYFVLWKEKHHDRQKLIKGGIIYAIGFLLLFLPFIGKNGTQTFMQMYQNTYLAPRFTTLVGEISPIKHFIFNFKINFFSFLSNPSTAKHYVSGPLVDRLTAFFVLGGFAIILFHIKKAKYIFIGLVVVGIVAVAGGLYAVREIVTSRLYLVVPFWCLCAGICLSVLYNSTEKKLNKFVRYGFIACIVVAIFGLNAFTFYKVTPSKIYSGPEPLYIKLLQEKKHKKVVIVEDEDRTTFLAIAKSYGLSYVPMTLAQFTTLQITEPLILVDRTTEEQLGPIIKEKGMAFAKKKITDTGGHFVEYYEVEKL